MHNSAHGVLAASTDTRAFSGHAAEVRAEVSKLGGARGSHDARPAASALGMGKASAAAPAGTWVGILSYRILRPIEPLTA